MRVSFNDNPLIQEILKTKTPVIASTGGAELKEIDNFVTKFDGNKINFAINHCIPIYPTPRDKLELNQIDNFKKDILTLQSDGQLMKILMILIL